MGILLGLRTTALNPTVWLLVALAASAVAALVRGETARAAFLRVLAAAARTPVLAAIGLAVLGGVGSRVVVGYLAPGSYAEEVLAARSFVSARQLYDGGDRLNFSKWLTDEPAPVTPWTLPGLTVCQASALESRPQFYTAQGHSPALLMISVPIVALGGGRMLYVVFVLLSLVALGGMAAALAAEAGVPPGSAAFLVLLLALAGWQPALAGIRQGDAVIVVTGLVVWTWRLLRRGHAVSAGVTAGLSGALFLPALALLVPVGLRSRRALVTGLGTVLLVAGATVAVAGPMISGRLRGLDRVQRAAVRRLADDVLGVWTPPGARSTEPVTRRVGGGSRPWGHHRLGDPAGSHVGRGCRGRLAGTGAIRYGHGRVRHRHVPARARRLVATRHAAGSADCRDPGARAGCGSAGEPGASGGPGAPGVSAGPGGHLDAAWA